MPSVDITIKGIKNDKREYSCGNIENNQAVKALSSLPLNGMAANYADTGCHRSSVNRWISACALASQGEVFLHMNMSSVHYSYDFVAKTSE